MKNLSIFISESLNESTFMQTGADGMYHPNTKVELKRLVASLIEERGLKANLNDIDTSNITDMSEVFYESKFNGDISKWNVTNVEDMSYMFYKSKFNGDISKWNVRNVTNMSCMFEESIFNNDISKWDVSDVIYMNRMFVSSKFAGDINKWNVNRVNKSTGMEDMFDGSPLENNPPAWYKG